MAALMYVDVPGYAALLLRRSYSDLALPGALMDRAAEWLSGTAARWDGRDKAWRFPSGASLVFGYLATEADRYRYQSSEFQFCTAVGTRVLMSDGTHKKVEDICAGDYVRTLSGARRVTRVAPPRLTACVQAIAYDANGIMRSPQIHSMDHRVLTPMGWLSFDDIVCASRPSLISLPTQSRLFRKYVLRPRQKFQSAARMSLYQPDYLVRRREPIQSHGGRMDCAVNAGSIVDEGNDFATYYDLRQETQPLQGLCVPVVLHAPDLRSSRQQSSIARADCVCERALAETQSVGFQCDCPSCIHLCDERLRHQSACAPDDPQQRSDAAGQSDNVHSTNKTLLLEYGRYRLAWYGHPYMTDRLFSNEPVEVGTLNLTPIGERLVVGITIEDVSHYITESGLVQANCGFDELTQFTALQYTYLFSRLRRLKNSPVPIRMRSASNPGGVGHAWVYDRFPIGRPHETQATGRVFISAGLKDNPHIDQAEYVRSLSELDDITKAQLLDGAWVTDPSRRPFDMAWWRGRNRWGQNASDADRLAIARFISWDTAFKEENESDYAACAVFDLMPDYRLVLRSMWKEKLDFPGLTKGIEEIANLWRHRSARQGMDVVRAVIIEDKGSGTSALQTLRKAASPWLRERLVAFNPGTESKPVRGKQAALWCSRDCVVLPAPGADAPWLHDFETELQMFPDVTHDDQVDAFTQCILYCENLLATGWHARQAPDANR
jgi:predicted phage terminase large subunit-like protein